MNVELPRDKLCVSLPMYTREEGGGGGKRKGKKGEKKGERAPFPLFPYPEKIEKKKKKKSCFKGQKMKRSRPFLLLKGVT